VNTSFSGAFCAGVFTLGLAASADAALLSRLGGQAVYDTDLNITWLADANAAAGTAYDDGISNRDGRLSLTSAIAWATSLTVGGVNDWRLPTGDVACGIAINCTNAEMGHLFYDELGGTAFNSILTSGDPDLALFSNIRVDGFYGTTSPFTTASGGTIPLLFTFSNGSQAAGGNEFAWAVRDGDVGTTTVVSEPTILALLSIGLLGLMRRNRNRQ